MCIRDSTRLVQDAMLINGELQIFVLYESQEGKTDWVEQTVPYEGRIECAGAEEGMYHHVYDRLDDISVEVRMDEDGEMCIRDRFWTSMRKYWKRLTTRKLQKSKYRKILKTKIPETGSKTSSPGFLYFEK